MYRLCYKVIYKFLILHYPLVYWILSATFFLFSEVFLKLFIFKNYFLSIILHQKILPLLAGELTVFAIPFKSSFFVEESFQGNEKPQEFRLFPYCSW